MSALASRVEIECTTFPTRCNALQVKYYFTLRYQDHPLSEEFLHMLNMEQLFCFEQMAHNP